MPMSERALPPPPEGSAITAALKKSGLSAREAAKRAGLSEGRWRQIASGYQRPRAGVVVEVTAPPDTLARMAVVVGLTPEDLEAAGRSDAAAALRQSWPAAEGKPHGDTFDLDSYTPESPAEKALIAIYKADQRSRDEFMQQLLDEVRELRSTVDRLTDQKPERPE